MIRGEMGVGRGEGQKATVFGPLLFTVPLLRRLFVLVDRRICDLWRLFFRSNVLKFSDLDRWNGAKASIDTNAHLNRGSK